MYSDRSDRSGPSSYGRGPPPPPSSSYGRGPDTRGPPPGMGSTPPGMGPMPPGLAERRAHYVLLLDNVGKKVQVRTLDNGNFEGVLASFDKRHMNILLTKGSEVRRRRVVVPKEEAAEEAMADAVKPEVIKPEVAKTEAVKAEPAVKPEFDPLAEIMGKKAEVEKKAPEERSFILERRRLPGPIILRGELIVSVTLM